MKIKRITAMLLCVLTLVGLVPSSALAAGTFTIESQTNSAFDYLEYYKDGSWNDLNTPKHWVEQTGEIVYCVQHKKDNPHGEEYRLLDMSSLYSSRTLRGLQIIAENGYPSRVPSGFSEDEARQATANAIRFWLAEEGDSQQYSFTNRISNPTEIRAKSGYEHVLDWADQLLGMARSQSLMNHSISFSPFSIALSVSGDSFVGTTTVNLTNCNNGYQLDKSSLPSGSTVTGYTGSNGDRLTISVPKEYGNKTLTLRATGYDSRGLANFQWYGPTSSDVQNVFFCSTSSGIVTTATLHISTPAYGKIQVVKTDAENGRKLTGAVFGIYGDSACTKEITRLTVNSNGTAITGDLLMGTYYVKEITAPSGYVLNSQVFTADVTTSTFTVTVPNTPAKGKIEVTKTNSNPSMGDHSLSGAVFDVMQGDTVVASVTTGANGKGTSKEIPLGTYTVRERTAPKNFVLSEETKTVTLSYAGQTVPVVTGAATIANTPQVGTITVTKADAETGDKAQGDAKLTGAKFEIKDASGKVVDTVHALGTNEATSKELPLGSYTVTEIEAPEGYLLNSTAQKVTLSYGGQEVKVVSEGVTVKDQVKKGSIELIKFGNMELGEPQTDEPVEEIKEPAADAAPDAESADGDAAAENPVENDGVENEPPAENETSEAGESAEESTPSDDVAEETRTVDSDPDIKPPLAGVEFEIRLKSSGELYDTLTTDEDGYAKSVSLPYGVYVVTESKAKEGYAKIKPFEVFVSEDGKTYKYLLEDDAVEMMIRLVKEDAATKKTIPIAGTTFQILDGSGKTVDFEILYPQPHTLAEFVTDESGTLYLPAKLPYGAYKLVEVKAPTGYTRNTKSVAFNVSEDNAENGVISVSLANEAVMGTISIEKTGEVLTGATTEESKWGPFYTPVYEMRGIENAVFEVYAAENIGTGDGTVYHEAGALVTTLTTDANGKAATGKLHLGKYQVVEKSVPNGFVLDTTPHEVTLSYKDQNTAIVSEAVSIENQRQKASVQMKKIAEYFDYESGAFYDDFGAGFRFGLYTAEAIGDIPANALVDLLTTDKGGFAESSADLPLGKYYLKELDVPEQYMVDGTNHDIDLTSTDSSAAHITDARYVDEPIYNAMFKARFTIVKKDATDMERTLTGATFAVLHPETKAVITTITTSNARSIESCELPCGEYLLEEIQAPDGFIPEDTLWTISLHKDSRATQGYSISNKPTEVVLTKRSSVDGSLLSGATFRVFDANGEMVAEGTTDEEGKFTIRELPAGDYTFVEHIAPTGYSISDQVYQFSVDENGEVTGETESVNEPVTVIVEKKDSYDKSAIAGVAFKLLDSGGNAVKLKAADTGVLIPDEGGSDTFKVGDDGKATIQHLPIGDYSLVEAAPLGYVSAESYKLTVTDEHSESNPYIALIYNAPTALKVLKVHQVTKKPLSGAGFTLKVKDGLGFKELAFVKLEDGKYKLAEGGKETKLMVDKNGELFVIGVPLGEVWLEESVVPAGYFPVAAAKLTIIKDHCVEEPLTITIENAPSVKLGLDNDKYNVVIAIGLCAAGVGLVTWRFSAAKRRSKKNKED